LSLPALSLLHLAVDGLIQITVAAGGRRACRDMPSGQIERKKQHS